MHPLLAAVAQAGPDRRPAAVVALREALATAGGTLQRDVPGGVEVTFVWIGLVPTTSGVALQCGLVHHGGRSVAMERIVTGAPDGDVWHLSTFAPSDALVAYRFVVDDPFLAEGPIDEADFVRLTIEAHGRAHADPWNPWSMPALGVLFGLDPSPARHESILALADAPPMHGFAPDAPAPDEGRWRRISHTSAALGDTRPVSVQLPEQVGRGHPLVVLLDGRALIELAGLPAAVDAAVRDGLLPAPIVAYVHEADGGAGLVERTVELSCNPAHATMLAEELLPRLRAELPVDQSSSATVVGGASLGGLQSCFTAMEHPDQVHLVLSISGSYWYGTERDGLPEWTARRLASGPRPPLRLYQQIGTLEDAPLALSPGVSHLVANRHLRDVAIAKGLDVTYEETTTAHDMAAFRVAAIRGLAVLLGSGLLGSGLAGSGLAGSGR